MSDDKNVSRFLNLKVHVQEVVLGERIDVERTIQAFGKVNDKGEVELHMSPDEALAFAKEIKMMSRAASLRKYEVTRLDVGGYRRARGRQRFRV